MVTFANDVNSNPPLYYLADTLGSNGGNGFQQQVIINSSTYAAYEGAALLNINFQDGAGNIIDSWIESGETSSSTSTVYWIKLPNALITTVYIVFYGTGATSKDNSVTGGEPNYTGTYAQYDNGANVFGFYDNFAGVSLNVAWTTYGTGLTATVNNGLTLSRAGGAVAGIYNSATGGYSGGNAVIESLFEYTGGSGGQTNMGMYTGIGFLYCGYVSGPQGTLGTFTTGSDTLGTYTGGSFTASTFYIISILNTGAAQVLLQNYSSVAALSGSYAVVTNSNIMLSVAGNSGVYQWVRARAYPPSGAMPSNSFGSITHIVTSNLNNWF